jgi:hypothetical protein
MNQNAIGPVKKLVKNICGIFALSAFSIFIPFLEKISEIKIFYIDEENLDPSVPWMYATLWELSDQFVKIFLIYFNICHNFHPSLIFAVKARAFTQSDIPTA